MNAKSPDTKMVLDGFCIHNKTSGRLVQGHEELPQRFVLFWQMVIVPEIVVAAVIESTWHSNSSLSRMVKSLPTVPRFFRLPPMVCKSGLFVIVKSFTTRKISGRSKARLS